MADEMGETAEVESCDTGADMSSDSSVFEPPSDSEETPVDIGGDTTEDVSDDLTPDVSDVTEDASALESGDDQEVPESAEVSESAEILEPTEDAGETLTDNATDSGTEEMSEEPLPEEPDSDVEEQGPADDNTIMVDEDGHIEGAGYDPETMHEEIGHQDLQDIEDARNVTRSEILAEDSGINAAEGGLDALDASLSEQGKSDRIDAVDDMADKMREYEIAQGHNADYTDDADALASSEQQQDELAKQSTAESEQTGDDVQTGGLKDILSEASERGGEVSADDVPPPDSEGMDDNDRLSQRDAAVDAYERQQSQNSR